MIVHDIKEVNIGTDNIDSVIDINYDTSPLLGVDLLANNNQKKMKIMDIQVVEKNQISPIKVIKKILIFFQITKYQKKKINIDVTDRTVDPILENKSNTMNGEFKSIHTMTPNDIKNEKIDMLYKFRKLEGQGIKPTMNYNMNSNLKI